VLTALVHVDRGLFLRQRLEARLHHRRGLAVDHVGEAVFRLRIEARTTLSLVNVRGLLRTFALPLQGDVDLGGTAFRCERRGARFARTSLRLDLDRNGLLRETDRSAHQYRQTYQQLGFHPCLLWNDRDRPAVIDRWA